MRRAYLFVCCLVVCLLSAAQSHSFRFFPVKDKSLATPYQGLIGHIGSRFFLINRLSPELDLYIYDTVSQTGNKRLYPFTRQLSSILVSEKSMIFIGLSMSSDSVSYHYLELDEKGDTLRSGTGKLDVLTPLLSTIVSRDKKKVLFYQYFRKGEDSAFLQGSIIGADGEMKKRLTYVFKHDRERDGEPQTIFDDKGNVHVLVYDKYNNYRMSTDLTINTISYDNEEMISETFAISKAKLKTMNIFQNNACGCLEAQGTYADGMAKTVRGMYTLSFPITRSNELKQRFSPFTSEMMKNFRKGFNSRDKDISNTLLLQEMIQTDSGSYAVFRLTAELVLLQDRRMYGPRPSVEMLPGSSMLSARANTWNSSKLVYIKVAAAHHIEWYSTHSLDVYRFIANRYNRVSFNANNDELVTLLYLADKSDEPHPALVSIRNGNEVVEKLPEKNMTLSPIQPVSRRMYGAVYVNTMSNESGILLIQTIDL